MQDASLLKSSEVARLIGASQSYVNTLEKEGRLKPCIKLPTGARRWKLEDVQEYIETIQTEKKNC